MLATAKMPKVVLTYFGFQGAGEKIRLALTLGGIEFEDRHVSFKDWAALKPTTPYGQLPLMSIDDGEPFAQSSAMLRYAGKLATENGCPLYPESEWLTVEEALGFVGDIQRSWRIPVQAGIDPSSLGYDKDADNSAVVKKIRTNFVELELPKLMAMLTEKLDTKGGFLCGKHPTIADCELVPVLNRLTCGQVDHIPTTCLDSYTAVTEYAARFMALEKVKAWYDAKE